MTFSSSGQFGHDAFLRAYNDLPIPSDKRAAAVARWLDVSPRTVRDWVSGHHRPPLAVIYATWLESVAGRAHVHTEIAGECHWLRQHVAGLVDRCNGLEHTVDALRAEVSHLKATRSGPSLAANDTQFDDVPRPPHAPLAPRPRPAARPFLAYRA